LEIIGQLMVAASLWGLFFMPLWQVGKFFYVPGRIDQVKKLRFYISLSIVTVLLLAFLFLPLPHSFICPLEIQPRDAAPVWVGVPGILAEIAVKPGQNVEKDQLLARLTNIDIKLEIANREVLIERLKQRKDDIYIMVQPPEGDEFERVPFLENELVVVAQAGHALARSKAIPLARVARERFILREAGSGTRIELERFLRERGVTPNVRMELGSNEAIKHAVAAGLGVSVLSTLTLHVDPMLDHLAVLDVQGFPLKSEWFVVFPAQRRLSVVAQTFSDHLRAASAKLRASHAAATQAAPQRRHKKAA
jgi:hypothetical protein